MISLRILALIAVVNAFGITNSVHAQDYRGVDLYTLQEPAFDGISDYNRAYSFGGQVVGANQALQESLPQGAVVWSPPQGDPVLLVPGFERFFTPSIALGTDGERQVGYGPTGLDGLTRPLLWSGTAESVIDLTPTNLGIFGGRAFGIGGGQQVGSGARHALLWSGTPESAVDLHPNNLPIEYSKSEAVATDGVQQVGNADGRAILWSGTAESAVVLHPSGYGSSRALGVGGGQQVGSGNVASGMYAEALLWNGSSDSFVNLHPTDIPNEGGSTAYGTNGRHQVGKIGREAALWSGTPESAINLNDLLPFAAITSTAYSIDSSGNVYGIATVTGLERHAVMWVLVPEPSGITLAVLCFGLLCALQ